MTRRTRAMAAIAAACFAILGAVSVANCVSVAPPANFTKPIETSIEPEPDPTPPPLTPTPPQKPGCPNCF